MDWEPACYRDELHIHCVEVDSVAEHSATSNQAYAQCPQGTGPGCPELLSDSHDRLRLRLLHMMYAYLFQ